MLSARNNIMYETIKKFLNEGGKCLLIENGKPIGVVLTMEEYEKLKNKPEVANQKSEIIESEIKIEKEEMNEVGVPTEASELLIPRINSEHVVNSTNPIGEAMVKEMDFPEISANINEINLADAGDVTLEDLGLDELPY